MLHISIDKARVWNCLHIEKGRDLDSVKLSKTSCIWNYLFEKIQNINLYNNWVKVWKTLIANLLYLLVASQEILSNINFYGTKELK